MMRPVSKTRHIRTKMLIIILPLIVTPMIIAALVGFLTASREASKTSARYLTQRENDLRTLAENLDISGYYYNQLYGLTDEAEIYRQALEQTLKRFADRSNRDELIYPLVRYLDHRGQAVVTISTETVPQLRATTTPLSDPEIDDPMAWLAQVQQLAADAIYRSLIQPLMRYAVPIYKADDAGHNPRFIGSVVLDFTYPLQEFRRAKWAIPATFGIITALSLALALVLTISRVRHLTQPIQRLAEAANLIAAGERKVTVDAHADDEIGSLAQSFNDMSHSLERHETELQRRVVEISTLYDIGQEMIARVALGPILDLIVQRAQALLEADASLLALPHDDSDVFRIHAYSGHLSDAVIQSRFRAGEALGGHVVESGQPMRVGCYAAAFPTSPFHESILQADLQAWLAVPLKSHEQVMGVLYAASTHPDYFQDDHQRLLSTLADQAAIAIEHAWLYEQVQAYTEELELRVDARTHDQQVATQKVETAYRELEAAYQQLEDTNQQLATASRHKSEFLANMSHELRTPMNAIIGFTRLVMRRSQEVLAPRQYDNLQKILISAEHLLSLINDILDLSRIEAGRIDLYPVDFDLRVVIAECAQTISPLVEPGRVQLVQDIADDLPSLFSDPDKIKQILMNLLSNAAKFTHDGHIAIRVAAQDDQAWIDVADSGIGIPATALENIFEEFRQVDSSTTREYGGTGLGLTISRQLARLLGGDIAVQSHVGQGTTFTFTLPMWYRTTPPASDTMAEAPVDLSEGSPETPLVLVIDDDPNVVYLLQENLTEAGYQVVGVTGADAGISKAIELHPFAILLDILMPQKDGWQVLHELKADPRTRDIPVILLSIVDQKNLGYHLGAFDYLLKPFDRDAMLIALGRIAAVQPRLLVVDDDPQVIDLVRQLLEDEPYDIVAAHHGRAAIEAIEQRPPDMILLDLLMPQLDGFGVLEYLHNHPEYRDIPVIVVTAKSCTAAEQALLHERAYAVMQKHGLARDALIHEVQCVLSAYRPSRQSR